MSGIVSEGVPAGSQPVGSSSYACADASETSTFDDICRLPVCGKAALAKSALLVGDAPSKSQFVPSSPSMGPGANFFRMISGCSTEPPETMLEHFDEDEDEGTPETHDERPLPPLISEECTTVNVLEGKLSELKELFLARFGHDVDSDDPEEETRDQDGTLWIKTVGTGPCTFDSLEDQLVQVKALYAQRFGQDADEDSEADDGDLQRDADGTLWTKTVGHGPCTFDSLEEQLAEVKDLYQRRFGSSADEDDEEADDADLQRDADGTLWTKTVGTGPCTYYSLEQQLADVKVLYAQRFGQDIDDDSEDDEGELQRDADGTIWVKTVGTGPCSYDSLEAQLDEVKDLYRRRFGLDADEDSEADDEELQRDADGTLWIKTVGTGPCTFDSLEDQLAEVKDLYRHRFGRDADEDAESDGGEPQRDADGTLWIKTVGTGPCTFDSLEDQLAEVKDLYRRRFGLDADEDSEDGDEELQCDADGTLWIKTVGTGPCTFGSLEDQLAEVKDLYRRRFGLDADEDSEADDEEPQRDADGTPWIQTVGTGPCTYASLEDQLAEVKALYAQRFGRDVDEEEVDGEPQRDTDGTLWVKTVGTGPCTFGSLEAQLDEVKDLYRRRFGRDADEDSEDDDELQRDADGTLWIKTVGTGPCTYASLEDQLAEVKNLYEQRFGLDIDEDSESEELERDADGTPWIKVEGTGAPTLEVLEERLAEVQDLYRRRFGHDAGEDSEAKEIECDADGTPWIKIVGTGALTLDGLEEDLAEVKDLYSRRYGQDVDEDERSEADELELDMDGTAWIKTVGTGPINAEVLETRLEGVKELYAAKFGHDVDDEPAGEESEYEYDEEGTMWLKITGTGPWMVASL